jgi:pimeloyl-ACP methyl ester carboxylesterase
LNAPDASVFRSAEDIQYTRLTPTDQAGGGFVVEFVSGGPRWVSRGLRRRRRLANLGYDVLAIADRPAGQSCFHLGESRGLAFELSALELIDLELERSSADREGIITAGFGRGGFAALYYALKHGAGRAIAVAPVVRVGDYLGGKDSKFREIAMTVAGGFEDADRRYLNDLLVDVMESTVHRPMIAVYVAAQDYFRKRHVRPLVEALERHRIPHDQREIDYSQRSEVPAAYERTLLAAAKRLASTPGAYAA